MLKQFLDFCRQLLLFTQTAEQNRQELKTLHEEMDEMTEVMQQILWEFRHLSDTERHEREKLMLKMENEMLRFERRLPPGKTKDEE